MFQPEPPLIAWVIVSIVALAVLAVIGAFVWSMFAGKRGSRPERVEIRKEWGHIELLRKSHDAHGLELAVVRADRLLDHVLKARRLPGTTLGERLRVACARDGKLSDVWWAHKMRNMIVHENVHCEPQKLSAALKEFEKALKRLGAL